MLLSASLDLPVSAAIAAERLSLALRERGLDELSAAAYRAGVHTLTRDMPPGEPQAVRVETLEARAIDGGIRVPFRWTATGSDGQPAPTLDANLDITTLDEQHSTLSINASYTPPFGPDGSGDRLILHRAARATMGSLLSGLAGAAIPDSRPAEIRFLPDEPVTETEDN